MVSFVCDACQETLKKAKLEMHVKRCQYAVFSCIDCSVTFKGTEWKAHTSCITEVQKYQKTSAQKKKVDLPVPEAAIETKKRAAQVENDVTLKSKKAKKEKKNDTATPQITIETKKEVEQVEIEAVVKPKKAKKVKEVKLTEEIDDSMQKKSKTGTEQISSIKEVSEEIKKLPIDAELVSEEQIAGKKSKRARRKEKIRKEKESSEIIESKEVKEPKQPVEKKELTEEALYHVVLDVVKSEDNTKNKTLIELKKAVVKQLFKGYKNDGQNKISLSKAFDNYLNVCCDGNGNLILGCASV